MYRKCSIGLLPAIILSLLLLPLGRLRASDSISVSLLTCSPGEEVYTLFGHTAIRYENPREGVDVVFNYGLFDFNTPHFMLRFALGQTDYMLGLTPFDRFQAEYRYYNRSVTSQHLALTSTEATRLVEALQTNYLPENRMYRYNYFYDNCSTRPFDQIEKAVEGRLVLPTEPKDGTYTYRDIMRLFARNHPWERFGMDLCLGFEADRPIDRRQTMFAPLFLFQALEQAHIQRSSGSASLVDHTHLLVPATESIHEATSWTPFRCFWLLFAAISLASIYGIRRHRTLWAVDALLLTSAGLVGSVLAFLALFSQHPTVGSNLLLWVFHPLHLAALPWVIPQLRRGGRSRYLAFVAGSLTVFMLFLPLLPQKIDPAIVPLALCLLVRAGSHLVLTYKPRA
ncbi:MAG: DUF4105 domain-containing protein [Bacteroides sp.]|nr:DUF4105 domain-containing protein [Bacteroides sp.]